MQIGQKAPELSLPDSDQHLITLSENRGKNVLLLFFPLAFTSVCTVELCNIRDNISLYNHLNAEVWGISVDSHYTLDKFKAEQNLNFKLLSDFNREASKAYNVLYESFGKFGMNGVSKRAAFVIDKEGVIQYAEVCASPADQPDFEAIQCALQSLN